MNWLVGLGGVAATVGLCRAVPQHARRPDGQRPDQAVLGMVDRGEMPNPSLLAYAQCRPSRERMARSRFLSQGRKLLQQMQACVQDRTATLQLLQSHLEPVQVQQTWFSPQRSNWLQWAGWQAVELPEGDELQELDAMR